MVNFTKVIIYMYKYVRVYGKMKIIVLYGGFLYLYYLLCESWYLFFMMDPDYLFNKGITFSAT